MMKLMDPGVFFGNHPKHIVCSGITLNWACTVAGHPTPTLLTIPLWNNSTLNNTAVV